VRLHPVRLHPVHHPLAPVVVREPPTAEVVTRWSAGLVVASHGFVHGMGVALLWRLAEPGSLRYTDAVPRPGSVAGYASGLGWLVAGLAFVVGAVQLVRHDDRWLATVTLAAAASLPILSVMATQAPFGVAVDMATLVACAACWVRREWGPSHT